MLDTEQIKSLIRRKFAGDLSNQESSLLEELLSKRPELEILQSQLKEEYFSTTAQNSLAELRQGFDTIKEGASAKREKLLAEKKARSLTIWRISTAAAALVLLVAGIFWWQSSYIEPKRDIAKHSNSTLKLVLPSGEEVDLSSSVKKQIGNLTLNSNNQKLLYSLGTDGARGTATLHVPDGKDFSVQLSDGTEIQLNSGSTLTFPFLFPENSRDITISGEAYLKVAKIPAKPFRVRLQPVDGLNKILPTVQVLGTEFNVNTYDNSAIKVALVEGSVKMTLGNDSLRLRPGHQAIVKKGKTITSERFEAEEVLSWRNGILEFKGSQLEDVFSALPRWYGVQISVDDTALNGKLFTGAMNRNKPLNSFLEDLKFTHHIDFYTRGGVIHLKAGQ